MSKSIKKSLAVFLSVITLFSCFYTVSFASNFVNEEYLSSGRVVTSEKEYRVTNGVAEKQIVLSDKNSKQVKNYVLEIDLSNPDVSIIAGYKDADASKWGFATLPMQAQSAKNKLGVNVVGGINADQYDTKTGQPTGILVMNGKLFNSDNGRPYFAILNDGTAVIRKGGESADDVKEAVGGQFMLVEDGNVIHEEGYCDTELHPRTAVGIKADGTVMFIVSDGRQEPETCGITINDLADLMKSLGCVNAVSVDGGSSSTMISQHEYYSPLSVRNSPAKGVERNVSSTLLVCSKAEATGEFDHMTFGESEYAVAPYHSVALNLYSCDVNGFKVSLPDGKMEVEDSSYGKISSGKFTATGKKGTTNINYVVAGEVIASVPVTVTDDADNFIEQLFKKLQEFFIQLKLKIDKLFDDMRGGQS